MFFPGMNFFITYCWPQTHTRAAPPHLALLLSWLLSLYLELSFCGHFSHFSILSSIFLRTFRPMHYFEFMITFVHLVNHFVEIVPLLRPYHLQTGRRKQKCSLMGSDSSFSGAQSTHHLKPSNTHSQTPSHSPLQGRRLIQVVATDLCPSLDLASTFLWCSLPSLAYLYPWISWGGPNCEGEGCT